MIVAERVTWTLLAVYLTLLSAISHPADHNPIRLDCPVCGGTGSCRSCPPATVSQTEEEN